MKKEAPTDHPIHPLIRQRWSPRAFADRDVDAETLRSLLEAARWAPSCYNEQPWAFIVATRDDTDTFARLLDCLVPFNREWAQQAPVLMLAVARGEFARNGKANRHGPYDTGQAAALLTVQAESMGLRVHQMAGFDAEKASEVYGIPESCEPMAMIAIGYQGDPDSLSDDLRKQELGDRSRRSLDAFVYGAAWGEVSSIAAAAVDADAADADAD